MHEATPALKVYAFMARAVTNFFLFFFFSFPPPGVLKHMQILPAFGRKFGIFPPPSLGQSLKSRKLGAEKIIFKNKLTNVVIGVLTGVYRRICISPYFVTLYRV